MDVRAVTTDTVLVWGISTPSEAGGDGAADGVPVQSPREEFGIGAGWPGMGSVELRPSRAAAGSDMNIRMEAAATQGSQSQLQTLCTVKH